MRPRVLAGAMLALAAAAFTVFGAAPGAWAQSSDAEEAGLHRGAVEALDAAGILRGTGCTSDRLCPKEPLPRWAMAVWLVRALDGRDPPRSGGSRFADIASWQWWAPHVERLADLGVTKGCRTGPARFCPDRPVTRAQTASFLQRAFRLSPAPSAGFTDTRGSTHESAIDALAEARITVGCSGAPARYCPNVPVTRAQMASLVHRALRFNATVTWLSAGDSYSSGTGTDPHAEGSCRRSPSAAGPAAVELLRRQGWTVAHTHTACEGGFVEDMFNRRPQTPGHGSMWEKHEALGGPRRVDVVTLSLGGNDVGFEDVVLACVPFTRITELVLGCPSEAALRARIDNLTDPLRTCPGTSRRGPKPDYGCDLHIAGQQHGSIADFYRAIVSERLTERGRLYVIGYPSLIAPSSEWRLFDPCRALYKPDTVDRLGRLAEHLNRQLAEAVRRANEALGSERVHYVDTYTPFRDGGHEVCGRGSDFIHGITHVGVNPLTGWYRSFHLKNAGHAAVARLLADKVGSTFQAPAGLPQSEP